MEKPSLGSRGWSPGLPLLLSLSLSWSASNGSWVPGDRLHRHLLWMWAMDLPHRRPIEFTEVLHLPNHYLQGGSLCPRHSPPGVLGDGTGVLLLQLGMCFVPCFH